jgi:hypothetical protein
MYCNLRLGKLSVLLAAALITVASCRRGTTDDNYLANDDDREGYATEGSRIGWANEDIISLADQAGTLYNAEYIRKAGDKSVSVAVDTMNTPHTLIVRFGNKDVACADGRTRRGSIVISYNGRYSDTSDLHTITFNDYYINGNRMSGYMKVTRRDTTVTGDWYYNVQVNDTMHVNPDDKINNKFVLWNGNLVRRWVGGQKTNDRSDDFFTTSGTATLTRPSGHTFNFNIATPLQFATDCDFAQSGVVNVTGYTGNRVLNYGSGNCDNAAQLNIDVHVYQLTLDK